MHRARLQKGRISPGFLKAWEVQSSRGNMAAVQRAPLSSRRTYLQHRYGVRGPAILVVDDDREMCELAEAGLSQRGYNVTWRLNPDEALALLDQEDFSVLFVDIHMDGMSGLDLCRAALAKRPDLVVVVMTGFGSMEHAIGAMRAGAYDFITKPVPRWTRSG